MEQDYSLHRFFLSDGVSVKLSSEEKKTAVIVEKLTHFIVSPSIYLYLSCVRQCVCVYI